MPMADSNHIINLETQLAHITRIVEDLSDIVADQTKRLERAEQRIEMLMQRAAEDEAAMVSGEIIGDQRPPHW